MRKNRILVIAPVFGEYHKVIFSAIRKSSNYSKVLFIPEAPLYNLGFFAFVSKLFPFLRSLLIKFHNWLVCYCIKRYEIDTLFIIRGEFIDTRKLGLIKEERPGMRIITYQWDSIKNNPNAESLIGVSDSSYTFDFNDSENYRMDYLPLFYCWDEFGYQSLDKNIIPKRVDFFFVGGYRTSRVSILRAFKEFCVNNGFTYYFKSFERFGSYLINRKKLSMERTDISFSQLSYKDYFYRLNASSYVIDIQSPTQTGLTMRTMEALSLQKKLITTNGFIKKTPLYSASMVYVLNDINDINSPEFRHFLGSRSHKIDALLSLTNWLKKLDIL